MILETFSLNFRKDFNIGIYFAFLKMAIMTDIKWLNPGFVW